MSSFPSLRFHFLTPFYDFLFRVLLPEKKIRQALLEIGSTISLQHILEIGCGTGNFTILLSQKFPLAIITAIDMDEKAISILSQKILQLKIKSIQPKKLSATLLPYADKSFDRVYSSLLFCNLSYHEKLKTIEEARRVIHDEGEFLIADWSKPQTRIGKLGFAIMQLVGGKPNTEDMKSGKLKYYLLDAGFLATKKQSLNTIFGTINFYEATKQK